MASLAQTCRLDRAKNANCLCDNELALHPHRIRLRGPWNLRAIPKGITNSIRLPLPAAELAAGRSGIVELSRRFHCPTNLSDSTQVYICWLPSPTPAALSLNGEPLPSSSALKEPQMEWKSTDVRRQLAPVNLLAIRLSIDDLKRSTATESWGDVILEIHDR